jgi:hypothetical protein
MGRLKTSLLAPFEFCSHVCACRSLLFSCPQAWVWAFKAGTSCLWQPGEALIVEDLSSWLFPILCALEESGTDDELVACDIISAFPPGLRRFNRTCPEAPECCEAACRNCQHNPTCRKFWSPAYMTSQIRGNIMRSGGRRQVALPFTYATAIDGPPVRDRKTS